MLDRRAFECVVILLCKAFELGIKVKLLLLDRGFYSIELLRWLDTDYMMVNKFLAKTTSKIRKPYFYLVILLYNLWVLLNCGKGERIADILKLLMALALILLFIPDIEAMT